MPALPHLILFAMAVVCAYNIERQTGDCISIIGRMLHFNQLELDHPTGARPTLDNNAIRELLEICAKLAVLKIEFISGNTSMPLIDQAIPLIRRVYDLTK